MQSVARAVTGLRLLLCAPDCAPGFAMTGPVSDQTSTCSSCPLGKYCAGGDATNPSSSASQCPAGLATTYQGAKSAAQCFTKPGYGRQYARGSTGVLALSGVACPIGTYNTGSNTAGCFRCNPGLTTQQEGSTSITDCGKPYQQIGQTAAELLAEKLQH